MCILENRNRTDVDGSAEFVEEQRSVNRPYESRIVQEKTGAFLVLSVKKKKGMFQGSQPLPIEDFSLQICVRSI